LSIPLELEDGVPPVVLNRVLFILAAMVLLLFVWAAIGTIREVAPTSGEIVPSGQVQKIEHLEGGTIAEILVHEGDLVKAGTPLVRLSEATSESELRRVETRIAWLANEALRLGAELRGSYSLRGSDGDAMALLTPEQKAAFDATNRFRLSDRQTLRARIGQRHAEVASTKEEIRLQKSRIALEREKFEIQRKLLKRGYTSRRRYLDAQTEYQKAIAAMATMRGRLAQSGQALAEARAALRRSEAESDRQIATERSKLAQERAELLEQQKKFKDRYDRLYIRSPVDGYVKQIAQSGSGAVVRPGDLVAEIVPVGQSLVAEVRVRPSDIGHIKVNDTADVVVTSYDVNVQGAVPGKVETISASSFKDQQGNTFFKARIALKGRTVGEGSLERPLVPGMLVQANIVTGSKSILRYMLKPVVRSLDTVFSER